MLKVYSYHKNKERKKIKHFPCIGFGNVSDKLRTH
jgi:hypothetical protein